MVLHSVAAILEAEGFSVLLAANGPSALELAEETPETIHLLLSDVEMPEMSGPELGEFLKPELCTDRVLAWAAFDAMM